MSALITCETCMKSQPLVVAALEKLGVPREVILIANPGELLDLAGYARQGAKVEILIKKDFHKGYGDVGFSKDDKGNYVVYVDDLDDTGSLRRKVGTKFSSGVNQWYAAVAAEKALKRQGLMTKVQKKGDLITVVARG